MAVGSAKGCLTQASGSLSLDLGQTTTASPAAISAIAGVDRRARASGVRFSIVPGGGGAAITLRRAGLLDPRQLEGGAEVFMD
jgi:anti-anti-sigma regulatory factor